MTDAAFWASMFFAGVSAGLFGYVGLFQLRRPVPASGALAVRFFAVWWIGLAAFTAVGGLLRLLYELGVRDLPLWITATYLNLGLLCLALLGLLYYLLYLYTGKRSILVPLAVGYLLYFWCLLYFIQIQHPNGITLEGWNTQLTYADRIREGPLFAFVIAALLVPQMAGAVAYFTLYFRTPEPEQRYRIALVSWSIFVWFGSAYFTTSDALRANEWWMAFSRFLGLGAALTTLLAYRPPGWVKRMLEQQRRPTTVSTTRQRPKIEGAPAQARVIIRRPMASKYSISFPDSS